MINASFGGGIWLIQPLVYGAGEGLIQYGDSREAAVDGHSYVFNGRISTNTRGDVSGHTLQVVPCWVHC